jgi:hypothetical protein
MTEMERETPEARQAVDRVSRLRGFDPARPPHLLEVTETV